MTDGQQANDSGFHHAGRFGRRAQLAELCVFLFLIVPTMVLSFFMAREGGLNFILTAISTILRDLALVSLILYFVWRNAEGIQSIGWRFKAHWKDAALGAALFVPLFVSADLVENLLRLAGLSTPSKTLPSFLAAKGLEEFILALILVVVVAFAEETIFRGYLILRFKALTGSPLAAAALSAVIFSLGHGYEGSAGAIGVAYLGFVFALVYLWRGSLVAPMVMHFLQDFIGIIVVPLLHIH